MARMVAEDERQGRSIVTAKEIVGPKSAGSKGSPGDVALMDAIAIVVAAWVIVFLLTFSLRRHNV
jgi:hypothetical protein